MAKVVRILIGCEFSGIVRDEFLKLGHDAWSCDLLPTERPGPHIVGDVRDILDDGWDMMIAFPPCTHLCCAGAARINEPGRRVARETAIEFVRVLMSAPIERIAIENPRGVLSTRIRRPDQTIQPNHFGHGVTKLTCLWLKNLPPLIASLIIVNPETNWTNRHFGGGHNRRRSVTFPGIAAAMAQQWSGA